MQVQPALSYGCLIVTGQPWRPPTILVARFEIFPCALRFTFAWSLEQVARLAPHLQPPTWALQLGLHCSFLSSCDIFVYCQPTVVSSIPAASCHWRHLVKNVPPLLCLNLSLCPLKRLFVRVTAQPTPHHKAPHQARNLVHRDQRLFNISISELEEVLLISIAFAPD